MSDIDIINNEEFVYLTGSIIFEKNDKLDLSKVSKQFSYLYHSKEEFRNIIKYLLEIYGKENEIDKKINFSETIHPAITKYFITFLESTQEYIFYNPHSNLILYLGFPNSKVVNRFYKNEILQQSSHNWLDSIDFFLTF